VQRVYNSDWIGMRLFLSKLTYYRGQEGYREGLWNELPLNLKHISSSSAFKRNLRNYQLSLY